MQIKLYLKKMVNHKLYRINKIKIQGIKIRYQVSLEIQIMTKNIIIMWLLILILKN